MDKLEFSTSLHNEKRPTLQENTQKTAEGDIAPVRKLARNAVICFALLVCLMAVKTFGGDAEKASVETASSELAADEDIGKLQFVSNESYSEPIEGGEVVSVFSDNCKSVGISAEPDSRVLSVLTGVVTEIGDDYVKMENDNGTVTEYMGVRPSIHAGEEVQAAQVIGYLLEEELTVTTAGNTGYIDTLDPEALTSSSLSCEK